MSITIDISSELEQLLKESAARRGVDVRQFVLDLLKQQLSKKDPSIKKERELELLEKINLGIAADVWDRYNDLKEKRDAELLTQEEQRELVNISDQIEAANVQRIAHLIELAELREVSLDELMKSLGLQSVPDA